MALARRVFMISGGVSKFTKARDDVTFEKMVFEAFDNSRKDLDMTYENFRNFIEGGVGSYFSDHFSRQLMSAIMIHGYLGLCPKPGKRIESGGATGGMCFQDAAKEIASGTLDTCVAYGFEKMSHVPTWKGNTFIALASDVSFDADVGGFYSGYYAAMVNRHMHEFGTTREQLAAVAVKNYANAALNPYAQKSQIISIDDVLNAEMIAYPLGRYDICLMSDGAAVAVLASEEVAKKFPGKAVEVTGVGCGTDEMRMADRPQGDVILLPHEKPSDYEGEKFKGGKLAYPGVHSFRAGRVASKLAYEMAGIKDPSKELDLVELHDAYSSSEIQTLEDMGLCLYGEGGSFVESGAPFVKGRNYGSYKFKEHPKFKPYTVAVNPSGGLIACGHPVGATGLMQAVFAYWQLTNQVEDQYLKKAQELGWHTKKIEAIKGTQQMKDVASAAIHSHAGTGTYVTVSILNAVDKNLEKIPRRV